jgi:flagellar basal body-associated protein FliL
MAKKAKIDLFDIDASGERQGVQREDVRADAILSDREGQVVKEEQTDQADVSNRRTIAARLKTPFIIFLSFAIIVASGGFFWWFNERELRKETGIKNDENFKSENPEGERMVPFNRFVVDVRDHKGDMRLALYDLVLELENPRATGVSGDRVDVRSAIHAVLRRKQIVDGLSPEGRALIRIELMQEVNRLLGGTVIKKIYIIGFEVI